MKDCALGFAVREYCNTTHDRFDWVGVDNTFLDTWNEESRFATLELIVKVDKEREERGLASVGR